jgi:hypothetical protein
MEYLVLVALVVLSLAKTVYIINQHHVYVSL